MAFYKKWIENEYERITTKEATLFASGEEQYICKNCGDSSLLDQEIVAVIGQRDINDKEKTIAKNTGKFLARHGYVVLKSL